VRHKSAKVFVRSAHKLKEKLRRRAKNPLSLKKKTKTKQKVNPVQCNASRNPEI